MSDEELEQQANMARNDWSNSVYAKEIWNAAIEAAYSEIVKLNKYDDLAKAMDKIRKLKK